MSRFRPAGILSKLLLVALPPILLLAILLSVYVVNARLDDLDRALRDRGETNARQMASTALLGLFTGDRQLLQADSHKHLSRGADILEVVIRNASAEVVARATRPGPVDPDESTAWFVAPVERPTLRADYGQAQPPGEPLGEVAVRFSNRQARHAAHLIVRNAVLISATAVLLTLLFAFLVGRQIVRPVQRLRQAVNRVREGDFSVRLPETSQGEIGDLEVGFNTMAEAVASAADKLQGEIEQATADLQQTMDALEVRNIELDIARKRALEASAAKSEFLANMSHEIRTPMSGVLGFADLLRKTPLDHVQRDHVETIIESAQVLLANLNEILDFSKMEAGKLTLEQRPFSLREVVADTVRLFAAQARTKGLDLSWEVSEAVPDALAGDPVRLRQILNNLIGNGVKFTERGGVKVQVNGIAADGETARLEFIVRDSGIGIPGHTIDKLFEPFSQGGVETPRLFGGTGLGLSICRRLAEAMGGEIGASSASGGGSVFVVELPFRRLDTTTPAVQEASQLEESGRGDRWLVGRRFLIADDNEINLNLLEAQLRGYGADTVRAADGEEAVREGLSGAFDMAFIDIHMPRRDGISASIEIHAAKPELPIVALTADVTQRRHRDTDGAAPFVDYLIKPLDHASLGATIAHVLGLPSGWRPEAHPAPLRASESAPLVPVRDTQRAIAQAAGSRSIADALFMEFVDALPGALTKIDEAEAAGDWEDLWQATHRLQGAAATCSLPALYEALAEFNRAARLGERMTIKGALAVVHAQARRVSELGR